MSSTARLLSIILIAAAFHRVQPAAAQGSRELLAVLQFEPIGTTRERALAISDRVREHVLRSGQYRLVERELIDKVLAEQAFQQTGCTSQECAVQAGKILGVRKIMTGRLTSVGEQDWVLSASIVDVESGELTRVASVDHHGTFLSLLGDSTRLLAERLVGQAAPVARITERASAAAESVPGRTGFGLSLSYMQLAGTQELDGGSTYRFDLTTTIAQIDYAWAIRPNVSLTLFLRQSLAADAGNLSHSSGPEDTDRIKTEALTFAGGDVRYWWQDRFFGGAAMGMATDEFEYTPAGPSPSRKDLIGSGLFTGVIGGWIHPSGAFAQLQLLRMDLEFERGKHGYTGFDVSIGYRFQ